jgi:hypothetical protein
MLPVARERWPAATTITTNAGIDLFGRGDWPAYYLIWDHVAAERYAAVAREAQRAGTVLVAGDRLWHDPQRCPHTEHYDIRLTLHGNETAMRFVRGKYRNPAYSGLLATQFAINNGAESMAWVGMEGFRDGPLNHIDGRPCAIMDPVGTHYIIAPYMQSCVDECPQIPFTFYGRPRFRLGGDNLTVIREAELVAA